MALENHHQQLKDLLARGEWENAQTLWLDLAEKLADQPEFLLLLVNEFTVAGQAAMAAELASLIAPNLKAAGKPREWLFALKLQASVRPMDKPLRTELVEAYHQVCEGDARLRTILSVASLDEPRTPLPNALRRVDTLLALNIGAFCHAKSWGFGRVKAFDATLGRLIVSFPHNPEHALQLAYAADNIVPVSTDHIEVRKLTESDAIKQLAATDPLALLRVVLLSHNRAATADQIESTLGGSVIPTDKWKKWWENTRKLLKKNPHFDFPEKKTDPIVFRTVPVSQQDELLVALHDARGLSQKIVATRQLLKLVDEIENPDLLVQEFEDGLLESIKTTRTGPPSDRLEAAVLLEELQARQAAPDKSTGALLTELLAAVTDLPATLDELSAVALKRSVATLKTSQPQRLIEALNRLSARVLVEIADLLTGEGAHIEQRVRNHTASAELLYWLCEMITTGKTATKLPWLETLPRPVVLLAVLEAVGASGKSARRLHKLLLDDEALVTELLVGADIDNVRDVARRILGSATFEELDRRSLMARIVKEYDFVQDLLATKSVKEQPLIVSWASYQRRKQELDDIAQKKIPQISKEIALARSYGDLSENFEYKAAKDMQKLLLRQRAELEMMLARAQGTDFANAKTDTVQIGTSVTVTDTATGHQHTHHILGAWDSNPARDIISYPAALAQTLLNKKVGEVVEVAGENGAQKLRIDRIEKVPGEILGAL
ncbi:MAG: GreA/GreB family elongation factor [Verrucomicrobiia bacterium]